MEVTAKEALTKIVGTSVYHEAKQFKVASFLVSQAHN